jgi:hypothetical protein
MKDEETKELIVSMMNNGAFALSECPKVNDYDSPELKFAIDAMRTILKWIENTREKSYD